MDPAFPVLSLLIFLPIGGALLILLLPGKHMPTHGLFANAPGTLQQRARWIALGTTLAAFVISLVMFILFERGDDTAFQFVDEFTWIGVDALGFNVSYAFGVDGLSMPLVLLTTLLTTVAVLVSWRIDLRPKEYFIWILVLETSVLGVFTALDLIFFFLFWELELIPMFLLISIWGSGNRNYSAMKFVLYTIFGSAFMLAGFLALGSAAGTFDFREIRADDIAAAFLPAQAIFAFILIAFAIKLPVAPLHTWLPDAHTDAPTAVSVLLAGVLLKMGGYGILRLLFTLMPDVGADADLALAIIGAVSIVYGAVITVRQTDLKRLVAYSSVSHMGFVLLGVSALGVAGMSGAALQLVTHGLITGMLFVMVGLVYDRTHTREIAEMRGLMHYMPVLGIGMVFAGLAGLGLPALAGFVAEITIFLDAFRQHPAPVAVSLLGVLLAAAYILWALQRTFFGPRDEKWSGLSDAGHWTELSAIAVLAALIVLLGVYPRIVVDVLEQGVRPIADGVAAVVSAAGGR